MQEAAKERGEQNGAQAALLHVMISFGLLSEAKGNRKIVERNRVCRLLLLPLREEEARRSHPMSNAPGNELICLSRQTNQDVLQCNISLQVPRRALQR